MIHRLAILCVTLHNTFLPHREKGKGDAHLLTVSRLRSVWPALLLGVLLLTATTAESRADEDFSPEVPLLSEQFGEDPMYSLPEQTWQPEIRETVHQDSTWGWWLLPEGLLYKSYVAGEKEPRFSSAFLAEQGGDVLWDSVLGGRVGLVRYGTQRGIQPEGVQLDIEGGAFVRLLPTEERDVQAVDFRMGVPLTYREGPFQAKFGYYHISSHLGDEFLLKNPGFDRINYVRDAFVIGVGYFPIDSLRLYAEASWAFFTGREGAPWDFQTGLEWGSPEPTAIYGSPFFAMNVLLREETDWSGSLNVLAGWQWRGFTSDHVFRAGLQYFTGKNNQYSFTQDNQTLIGAGIRYDY